MWNEFKSFLIKQNALALAIAVVIGGALDKIVKSLVDSAAMSASARSTGSGGDGAPSAAGSETGAVVMRPI